jgi:2-polyprenyl-3-methyl-5-hydroxy-6-metoxy-1,4-benzoquinol methylase
MKTLFKKTLNRARRDGLLETAKKVGRLLFLKTNQRNSSYLLKKYIDLHNKSYAEISRLVLALNNGIHPKHRILNYHKFFVDNLQDSDTVLDIGCGNGYLAYDLAAKAKEVIGIDIEPSHIAAAQKNYIRSNLQFLTGDATTYVYGKTVDKIILSNVLEHIEDRQTFLNRLHPIAPVILLRVPLITRDWLAFYKKENGFEYRLDQTHFIEYRPEELIAELEKSNWRVESFQINWGEFWGKISSSSL